MCKVGDIILVKEYKDGNKTLKRHSFVVISDENGEIEGLPYDMICNVLSSFKDNKQKKRKLSYQGNFPIANDDTFTVPNNGKGGYLKTDQLYYFRKDRLNYEVIGYMRPEVFDLVVEFINDSNFELEAVLDNLK